MPPQKLDIDAKCGGTISDRDETCRDIRDLSTVSSKIRDARCSGTLIENRFG
jgi:hypothetical protein